MEKNRLKTQKCTFSLTKEVIDDLELYSEFTSIPKSVVVRLALKKCFQSNCDFIENKKCNKEEK